MHLVTARADMHHFSKKTSLLYGHNSIKKINQYFEMNFEMKKIVHSEQIKYL